MGEHSNLFRPPFGGRRPAVLRIVRQMGLEPIMWNVTGYDWNAPSVEHIERKVISQVRGGDVILLHDGGHRAFGADRSYTVAATDRLISRYKSEGFEFVTIPEMSRSSRQSQSSVSAEIIHLKFAFKPIPRPLSRKPASPPPLSALRLFWCGRRSRMLPRTAKAADKCHCPAWPGRSGRRLRCRISAAEVQSVTGPALKNQVNIEPTRL